MQKILLLGSSLSKHSINVQLAKYAGSLLNSCDTELITLHDIDCPIYNIDTEKESGIPASIKKIIQVIQSSDGIICSASEHNANMTAAFKSVLDWASRAQIDFLKDKKILLLSTSPGGYGGQNARAEVEKSFLKFSGTIVSKFSLPKFQEHFKDGKIIDEKLQQDCLAAVQQFQQAIK